MTRLFISIIITVFGSLFLIGWGLDKLVAQQPDMEESNDVVIYKQIIEGFNQELSKAPLAQLDDTAQSLAKHYQLTISLDETTNIALPSPLNKQLNQQGGLLLASDTQPYLLRTISQHPEYLIKLPLPTTQEENQQLNIILTAVLYLGVCVILMIWLLPLARRLFVLTNAAAKIGKGDVNVRVSLSRFSYIFPLEKSFNQMASQIEKLMADNKLLARSLSHDIRTPMSCLRFGVEAALDTKDIDKKNNYLTRMESELTNMEEMTTAFLSYASMERQGVNLKLEKTDINQFIDTFCQSFQSLALQQQVQLENQLLEQSTQLFIDQHWFYRALQNLVSNALQYANQQVKISLNLAGQLLVIVIEDDGKGLDPKKFDVVFDPFVKLDVDRSREQGHFGLGLAICAKVIHWHKGEISAQNSTILGGAKFTIRLPF